MVEKKEFIVAEELIDLLVDGIRNYLSKSLMSILYESKRQRFIDEMQQEGTKRNNNPNKFSYLAENRKTNWAIIHHFITPEIETCLKERYNLLNYNEIKLCLLLFFKVPCKTIADLLPYTVESVSTKQGIIKSKAGIKDIQELYRWIFFKVLISKKNPNLTLSIKNDTLLNINI